MKKILFIVPSLGMGGMERVLVNYANLFSKRGYDVTVYNLTHHDESIVRHFLPSVKYQFQYMPVKSIKKCGIKNLLKGNFRLLDWERWLAIRSPEYLHKCFVKEHFDIEISFSGFATRKIVGGADTDKTVTAGWIHGELRENDFAPIRTYEEAVSNIGRIQKLICVSEGARQSVPRLYHRTKDLYVVHNPNDSRMIRRLAQEDGYPEKRRFTFITVARFHDLQKGFSRLFDVCEKLNAAGCQYDLWLVGDGVDYESMKALAGQKGLDNVIFFGKQENPYKYIKNADMYLCASYSEGFSMVMMEAVILAKPMLTTLVPGAEEMLGDSEYGLVVENSEEGLYQGMKRILEDPALYAHYCEKAEERKDYLSEDKIMDQLEAILEG